jgi:Lectin C-type domain
VTVFNYNYQLNKTIGFWPYNFNYWTGATQKDCKGQWTWCSGSSAVALPENLTWGFNQPDNKAGGDDCIQMRLMQNATGIALFDRNCTDKFVIACEVKYDLFLENFN